MDEEEIIQLSQNPDEDEDGFDSYVDDLCLDE